MEIASIWVGGLLTIAGTVLGLAGSLTSGWLDRRNRRHRLLRGRYEEFGQCITDTLPWFSRLASLRSLDEVRSCLPPEESRRMVLLSLVYFPEFKKLAAEYHNGLIVHFGNAVDVCNDPLIGRATVGAIMAKRLGVAGAHVEKMTNIRQALDDLLEKYASKYAKA